MNVKLTFYCLNTIFWFSFLAYLYPIDTDIVMVVEYLFFLKFFLPSCKNNFSNPNCFIVSINQFTGNDIHNQARTTEILEIEIVIYFSDGNWFKFKLMRKTLRLFIEQSK